MPGVDDLLAEARASLNRIEAAAAHAELETGALLVDTRPLEQRNRHGDIPGAVTIGLNVLEWRLDPSSPTRIPEIDRGARRVIVVCQQGFSSSLAAARLRRLDLDATDVIGGFEAWRDAGLPVAPQRHET